MTPEIVVRASGLLERVESGQAGHDEVAEALDALASLKEQLRDFAARFEAAAIAWIQEHGDVEIGDVRYYVGADKVTKCTDVSETLRALLDVAGGDLDAVANVMASEPFKHGAARTLLGDASAPLFFRTELRPDLRTGKPKRRLQRADTAFAKPRKGAK